MSDAPIRIYDQALSPPEQQALLAFLLLPSWGFGAYSSESPGASRYWYKHFAGYARDSHESGEPEMFEAALVSAAPLVSKMWHKLNNGVLAGHSLTRCYANAYPYGSEGGVHLDSNMNHHYTTIYYPHTDWHPDYAGETVFFNSDQTDIQASVYPKPNRLIIFKGVIPHSARGVSRVCPTLRVTLMFKTALNDGPKPLGPGSLATPTSHIVADPRE